jgi:ribosome-interacting GTPase 1
VVLVGPPNVGKSSLLAKLTNATPAIAAYPFTTREPVPGMMDFEDVRVQLIDLPPITQDHYEPFITDLTRGASAALLFLDLADDDGAVATQAVIDRLKLSRRELIPPGVAIPDDPAIYALPTLLIANKCDAEGAELRLELAREVLGSRFRVHIISAERGDGLAELRKEIYLALGVMRVYTKQPGKPADRQSPFTPAVGSTVAELAGMVHRDLEDAVKSARVWGSGAFDGQTVGRDHVLADQDIVELHT